MNKQKKIPNAMKKQYRATALKLLTVFNLNSTKGLGGKVYNIILSQLHQGISAEKILTSLDIKVVMEKAQQQATLKERQRELQLQKIRRDNAAKSAFSLIGMKITRLHGERIWAIVKRLADEDVTADQIVEKLHNHFLVEESHANSRTLRAEQERIAAEKHRERLTHRVDMRDVLQYLAEKNGTTYAPPKNPAPKPETLKESPLRNTDALFSERPLKGKESLHKENPRTYGLPYRPVNAPKINTDHMTEARVLVGIHFPDFLKYHLKNKENGLDAHRQAERFMAEFYPTAILPIPANDSLVPPGNRSVSEDKAQQVTATEVVKSTWMKEEKQEAREKAQAAALRAREQKDPQHIIDPVIVNGVEYRSTWHAIQTLNIGEDADARRFRREVKAKGEEIWTHDGEQYRFELKNKRPEQVEAIRKEEQELIDVELKASGRVAEVFQRDPRAQAVFRKLVLENFGERCAVTGKRLNGVLEAAHIEGVAVDGCYNASNGVLLAPTFHKLYDRHMMGINPETLAVHFSPGIEWEEYEGKVIKPLKYHLDKTRLAGRWEQFKGKKGN